jgi:hypothetical protein
VQGERQMMEAGTEVPQPLAWMALKNAIQFRKSVENGAFEHSSQIFAQLKGVGPVTSKQLYTHVRDFRDLFAITSDQMREWTGKIALRDQVSHTHMDAPAMAALHACDLIRMLLCVLSAAAVRVGHGAVLQRADGADHVYASFHSAFRGGGDA